MLHKHLVSNRKAKARGWEGPYRYRTSPKLDDHAGVYHGWIVKRGQKWLHFYSVSRGRMRVLLSEERYMQAV